MIVCLCAGVNDRKVKRVIDDGATTLSAVGEACGAGAHCGGCRDMIAHLIAQRCGADAAAAPVDAVRPMGEPAAG